MKKIVICARCTHYVSVATAFSKYRGVGPIWEHDMCKEAGEGKRRIDPISGDNILVKAYPSCQILNRKGKCPKYNDIVGRMVELCQDVLRDPTVDYNDTVDHVMRQCATLFPDTLFGTEEKIINQF